MVGWVVVVGGVCGEEERERREEGVERRRGENRLLCTCRVPDHMQTPQSLLISALHSVCWREGKREEKEEEEKRKRKTRQKKERTRKKERESEKEREREK